MLTMTVMQHERGAVGGFSKEVVEDKEDVLSCLRHLHRTLQECHWRVQSVDHALCAQGNKGLDGHQNQSGNYHNFQDQAGKDYSLKNQPGEDYNLQDKPERDCSLQSEAGKDNNFQDKSEKKENLEDQFRKISEQAKYSNVQDNPEEDHNHQNEIKEEFRPKKVSWEDHYYQKPTQEKDSLQDVDREDESSPLPAEDKNLFCLCSDSSKHCPSQLMKDSNLSKAASNDHNEFHYPIPDHYIDNQVKKEKTILNSIKSICDLDYRKSHHEQSFRGSITQDRMDGDDSAPVNSLGTVSATVGPQHIFEDPSTSDTSAVPCIMTDDIQHQLLGQNLKCSDEVTKEVSQENCNQLSQVRYRAGHKEESYGSKVFHEGEMDFVINQRINDASLEDQNENKTMDAKRAVGKVSPVDTFPEVTQKMEVIWETLENLQTHFLALHSSIVDSSSHCLNQELDKSLDGEDEMLHQTPSDTTQLSQSFLKKPSHKKTVLRKLSQPVCHTLSRNYVRSCPLHQHPSNEASHSNSTACRGILFRGWQEGCLCIGMVLLLLLLLLFLASCLLLVLPVVSVSVRTAGGLPAF